MQSFSGQQRDGESKADAVKRIAGELERGRIARVDMLGLWIDGAQTVYQLWAVKISRDEWFISATEIRPIAEF